MSRNISATGKQALFSQETSEVFLILITIDHADLAQPIRVTSDSVDTVSRGNTFVAFPFELDLPTDTFDAPPRARLTIDNIDRQIVQAVRDISSPAEVLMEIILASAPDNVEVSFPDFKLSNVNYDALTVSGDLIVEDFSAEPYPARVFGPADFPGIF